MSFDHPESGGTVSTSSQTVNSGETFVCPKATRSGFNFVGWYRDQAKTTFGCFADTTYGSGSSITLYAEWAAIQAWKPPADNYQLINDPDTYTRICLTLGWKECGNWTIYDALGNEKNRVVGPLSVDSLKSTCGAGGCGGGVGGHYVLTGQYQVPNSTSSSQNTPNTVTGYTGVGTQFGGYAVVHPDGYVCGVTVSNGAFVFNSSGTMTTEYMGCPIGSPLIFQTKPSPSGNVTGWHGKDVKYSNGVFTLSNGTRIIDGIATDTNGRVWDTGSGATISEPTSSSSNSSSSAAAAALAAAEAAKKAAEAAASSNSNASAGSTSTTPSNSSSSQNSSSPAPNPTTTTPSVVPTQPTSTASIQSCYQAYDFGQLGNIPQVIVSNRTSGAISLDLLINGIESGSCVGVDIWMGKEPKPTFSIFGIYGDKDASSSTPKFRLYLADQLLSCTPLTIRGWYTSTSSRSQYGTAYNSSGCNGMAPEQSQLVAQSKGYLLANQSALDSLANERAKYSGIAATDSTASATTGSSSSSGTRGVPPRPSSPRLKITDLKVQLTVTVGDGTTSVTGAYLINPELGFGLDNILSGTVIRNQAIFEFPLDGATAGTSTVAEIYAANLSGTSQALELPIALPEIQQPASLPGNNSTKPSKPSNIRFGFSGLNATVTVDLPNQEIAKASNVVLTSPLLGYTSSSPLSAKISGNSAIFEIRLTQLLLGQSAAMQIYSVNSSGQSETLDTELKIPSTLPPTQPQGNSNNQGTQNNSSNSASKTATSANNKNPVVSDSKNKFVPPTPESPKYRIQNGNVIVTVETPSRSGGNAETAYLVAPGVGITKDAPLKVKVKNDQAVFTIPIYESMAGKSTDVAVYSFNDAGLSKPLAGKVTIPKNLQGIAQGSAPAPSTKVAPLPSTTAKTTTTATNQPSKSTVKPTVKATTKAGTSTKTINCAKGTQVRSFVATACPTGWTKKN